MLPAGVLLTLFMDCCHSGTNSRFRPIETRAARPGLNRRFLPMTPELEAAHRAYRASRRSAARSSDAESLPGVVHFAACLDNQYAYEMDGAGNFTRTALQMLGSAIATRETNETFMSKVSQQVIALGHPQTPRLMTLVPALAGRAMLEPLIGSGDRVSTTSPEAAIAGGDLMYHLQAALRIAQGQP
jgi:hypothetical protein